MKTEDWEYFEDTLTARVITRKIGFSEAIGDVCRGHPYRAADALLLATISFVTNFDKHGSQETSGAFLTSIHDYRVVVVLSADVALLQPGSKTCGDLQMFWMATNSEVFR